MILAIDIGNTHIVIGLYEGLDLVAVRRVATGGIHSAEHLWLAVQELCEGCGHGTDSIAVTGISSVVPALTDTAEALSREYLGREPVTVSPDLDLGFRILYTDPYQVGADRLCNASAGFRKYGGPLIVVDFGTATTFDVISREGDYLGGAICLGVEASAAELHRRTARLPEIELKFPSGIIGKDTVASMQAGTLIGAVEAVGGIIRRIREELGEPPRVVATGGLGPILAKHIPSISAVEPYLVLEGIRLIVERVSGSSR